MYCRYKACYLLVTEVLKVWSEQEAKICFTEFQAYANLTDNFELEMNIHQALSSEKLFLSPRRGSNTQPY